MSSATSNVARSKPVTEEPKSQLEATLPSVKHICSDKENAPPLSQSIVSALSFFAACKDKGTSQPVFQMFAHHNQLHVNFIRSSFHVPTDH